MKKLMPGIVLLFLLSLLQGCMSFSNYQTAEVLEEGETKVSVGLTTTSISPDADVEGITYESISYVMPELMFRTSVSDRFEVGVKLYSFFPFVGAIIDGKYQFFDGSAFDAAVDLGVGYTQLEVSDERTTYTDIYPALLLTYHVSDTLSMTLAPKVVSRTISTPLTADETSTISGATLTFELGKDGRFIPEFGYYKGDKTEFTHYGIGFNF